MAGPQAWARKPHYRGFTAHGDYIEAPTLTAWMAKEAALLQVHANVDAPHLELVVVLDADAPARTRLDVPRMARGVRPAVVEPC